MHLFELAFSCRLYGQLSGFDNTLDRFRHRVGSAFDPWSAAHRAWLFEWLNSWGCRQFAKEHHPTTASTSLVDWADEWSARLPSPTAQLTDLSMAELDTAAEAYAALRHSLASQRTQPSGRVDVTYGPTGAAKTLFAIRPDVFPPWDEPIRTKLGFGDGAPAFRRYLTGVAEQLRQLSTEAGVPVSALPELVDRSASSPPKLIDEYNWVVITRKCSPPAEKDLSQWAEWARRTTSGVAQG